MIVMDVVLKPRYLLIVSSGKPEELMSMDEVFSRKIMAFYDGNGLKYESRRYVPGSTLKGILRSSATRVASLLGLSSCGEIEPNRINEKHEELNNFIVVEGKKVCHVCDMFGFPGGPKSPLRVSDGEFSKIYVDEFTRSSINRKSNVVNRGALYSYEEVILNSVIRFKIELVKDDDWMQRLLLASLVEIVYSGMGKGCGVSLYIENVKGLNTDDEIIRTFYELLVGEIKL